MKPPSAPSGLPRLPIRLFSKVPAYLPWHDNHFECRGPIGLYVRATTLFDRAAYGNIVQIRSGFRTRGLSIFVAGQYNVIEIDRNVSWSGRIVVRGCGVRVRIGEGSDGKGTSIVAWDKSVSVGRDCLFANGIEIRSSDIHPIVDATSGAVLNAPEDVQIGDRVWIATDSMILKGAQVASDSVVGARSVVTGAFSEPSCVLVGNPARVVRRGIAWRR